MRKIISGLLLSEVSGNMIGIHGKILQPQMMVYLGTEYMIWNLTEPVIYGLLVNINGAAMFNGQKWTKFTTENSGITSNNLYKVAIDSSSNVWFGSFDKGLSKYNGQLWTSYNTSNSNLTNDYIYAIETDTQVIFGQQLA